eukprot:SM000056S17953  [mRNA]  locus=s56:334849:336613:+ [translate_table: standard]
MRPPPLEVAGAADDAAASSSGSDSEQQRQPAASAKERDNLLRATSSGGSFLSWRKRKLSFRSPRAATERSEPLLNKAYGEDGGDEIDWDRRQAEEAMADHPLHKVLRHSAEAGGADEGRSIFGEGFAVGAWEAADLVSRDGRSRLCAAPLFFGSIDQCHESAAGEGACTSLVTVVADWLLAHPSTMPNRAELDAMVREGSAQWRRLCSIEEYKARFPDCHFDLETVMLARGSVASDASSTDKAALRVLPESSYVGFFRPEGAAAAEACASVLEGAMTYEGIWEEVAQAAAAAVYVVSWNDHFFVLKVDPAAGACFIIDTLGERLHEGCQRAYVLRFDGSSVVVRQPLLLPLARVEASASAPNGEMGPTHDRSDGAVSSCSGNEEAPGTAQVVVVAPEAKAAVDSSVAAELPCTSAEAAAAPASPAMQAAMVACRDFIQNFYAALPLAGLEKDLAKGRGGDTPLHRRLQVEFHHMQAVRAGQPT